MLLQNSGDLTGFLKDYLSEGDVVLVKASNGMNLKEVAAALI